MTDEAKNYEFPDITGLLQGVHSIAYLEGTAIFDKLQKLITATNKNNGWFDADRGFEGDISLLHSEVAEAFEWYREHGLAGVGIPTVEGFTKKPVGIGSELADIIIRVFDTAERYEIDILFELLLKMQFNSTRPYRHGNKVV